VAELVTSEFFEQGDRERSELKLTPSVSPFFHYHVFFTLLNDIFTNHNLKMKKTKKGFKERLLKVSSFN
jgi:hypothetical protein